jgi:hypothetical protein
MLVGSALVRTTKLVEVNERTTARRWSDACGSGT